MKSPLLKTGLLAAAVFCLLAMTSCTYDPYGTGYASYTYSNYPYGYTTSYLPYGYTSVYLGGTRYWHCNGHYYRHYPSRGYVVVKRPHGHAYHGNSSRHKPVHYTHYKGNRHNYGGSRSNYQNRSNPSYRGSGLRATPSTRYGSVRSPSRYNTVRTSPSSPRTVRTQPVSVRQMSPASSSNRRVRSRPTTPASSRDSNDFGGGGTIRRNPSGSSGGSSGGMSRGGGSRGGGSRGGSSGGGGRRSRS